MHHVRGRQLEQLGREVDDPPVAGARHVGDNRLRGEEHRVEIRCEHATPGFEGQIVPGDLNPGDEFSFYLITRVDPGYVLDADDFTATNDSRSTSSVVLAIIERQP